jgi:hypothetical protein
MMIKLLGQLKPDRKLVARVNKERLELADFWATDECPDALKRFMKRHGYEASERRGMLFATDVGVGMHVDQDPSIIWILGGTDVKTEFGASHELVAGGEGHVLADGQIWWVDTTQLHGVIAGNKELWSCYSINVEPVDSKA